MHYISHRQSSRHWRNFGVIDIQYGLPDMAISMVVNRLRPPWDYHGSMFKFTGKFLELAQRYTAFFSNLRIIVQMSVHLLICNCIVPF